MADFPTTIPKPSSVDEEPYRPSIRTKFEANYGLSRPKVGRTRNRFELRWEYLKRADFYVLKQFFEENQGTGFNWLNPMDSVTYTVGFAQDSLPNKYVSKDVVSLSVSLEQF